MAGRLQINTSFLYGANQFPFINQFKANDRPLGNSTTAEDHYALLDSTGMPTRMPSDNLGFHTFISLVLLDPADRWVVTWSGGTNAFDVQLGIPNGEGFELSTTITVNTHGRKEYQITSSIAPLHSAFTCQVGIGGVTVQSPVSDIKIFRKSEEAELSSGFAFRQAFIDFHGTAKWGNAPGRVRLLQWEDTTNGYPIVKWDDRTKITDLSWIGANHKAHAYTGQASMTANDYTGPQARSGNPSAWTHGMMITQRWKNASPAYLTVSAFSNANPAQVTTTTPHGLSTGNKVFFSPGSMSSVGANRIAYRLGFYTVTVVDPTRFTLDGVDSTTWGTYTSGGIVAKQVRAKAGNLPFKPIVLQDSGMLYVADMAAALGTDYLVWLVYDEKYDALMFSPLNYQKLGMPVELLVEFANRTGTNPVFSLGHAVDDDFAEQKATYVRNNIDWNAVNHTCWEFGNEWWNKQPWPDGGYALGQAAILWPSKSATLTFDPATNKVNWTGHSLNVGSYMTFTTTGALPTGLSTNGQYYILADGFGVNSFKIASAAPWNAEVDFSDAGTGTHTGNFSITGAGFEDFAYYGWRLYYVHTKIRQVFAGQLNKVRCWMDEWTVQTGPVTPIYKHAASGTGVPAAPITVCDEIVLAPYIEPHRDDTAHTDQIWKYVYGNATQKDEALQWLDAKMRQISGDAWTVEYFKQTLMPAWVALAATENARYGLNLKVACYEGGPGLVPNQTPFVGANPINGNTLVAGDKLTFYKAYYKSSYCGAMVGDFLRGLISAGVVYPSQYAYIGDWSNGGLFAAIYPNELLGDDTTAFVQALKTFNSQVTRRITCSS